MQKGPPLWEKSKLNCKLSPQKNACNPAKHCINTNLLNILNYKFFCETTKNRNWTGFFNLLTSLSQVKKITWVPDRWNRVSQSNTCNGVNVICYISFYVKRQKDCHCEVKLHNWMNRLLSRMVYSRDWGGRTPTCTCM